MSFGDTVTPLRTETLHSVIPRKQQAKSLNNLFGGITIPQNPGLAENNWNSGHQDSYCSESVGLTGPNSDKLRLIIQRNPYGFTPLLTCNRKNQMIGVAFLGQFRLIVFNSECEILTASVTGHKRPSGSFGGGYFFLNSDDNAVVVSNSKLACYPTANVEKKDSVYSLDPIWTSDDLVLLITNSLFGNSLYIGMPVWLGATSNNYYWILLAGSYDFSTGKLKSNAYIAVVEIVPDPSKSNGCQTNFVHSIELKNQWNNNTLAVSSQGVFFVTNACDATGACTSGYLHSFAFDVSTGKIKNNWSSTYLNSGFLKPGQKNIGSGTTPTLFSGVDGTEYVAITDNAYPQVNVVVYLRSDGSLVSQVPVFPKMRGCDEASLIGVKGRIVVENNFGHTVDYPDSQYIANEPGMDLIQVNPGGGSEVIWENNHSFGIFGMSMLARESGVIFANIGDWNVADSSTKGALYSISAIDSWDGREIWRIPLGQGRQYCRDYGGVYFNRTSSDSGTGTSLFIGTERFLVSIQNYDTSSAQSSVRDEVLGDIQQATSE